MFHALTILWTRWGTALIWLARGGGANFCLNVFSSEHKKEDACGDGKNGVWSFTPTTKSDVVRNAVSRNITLKLTITSSQLKKITCMWTNQNSKQSSSVSLQKSRLRFTIKPSGMFPSWISLHPDFKLCKTFLFFLFFIFYRHAHYSSIHTWYRTRYIRMRAKLLQKTTGNHVNKKL